MPVFLLTDIEGSTRLWETFPAQMGRALARHDAILRREIEGHGGRVVKHTGDGVLAVFEGGRPLRCALEVQKALAGENWGEIREIRVRVALHAGEALRRGEDYFGPALNRTARLLSSGWGGQILFTPEVLQADVLPEGASFRDLGFHFFQDLGAPQQVYSLEHPDLPHRDFPPLRSLSAHRHNLPVQPTPFIGREKELARLLSLLGEPACRLLTVTGPGGVGKTRLALQAAAERVEAFPEGVYFVPLAALGGPEFLPSAVADALGFSFYGPEAPSVQLARYLQGKRLLLLLDNFEHLVAGAGLLGDLLQAATEVKMLVTSREALRLHGEWVFSLEGMERPGDAEEAERNEAVQLFLQGARRVRPDFVLGAEEREAVVRICRLVEGLPLGIELAASWVRVLPCAEIAREIERGLDFLAASWRDLLERHRSLRAVFDYSWALLGEEERQALARLSVFRGGFRREAAEEVAGVRLPLLSLLVDRSLLRSAAGRYEMLEVVRQYAAERLREMGEGEWRERHGLYYLRFLERQEGRLKGREGKEALEEVQGELGNVREAWRWAGEGGKWEEVGRAAESLGLFYEMRSLFYEGEEAFRRAEEGLRRSGGPAAVLGRVLARRAWCCERLGRYQEARGLLAGSLRISRPLGEAGEVAFAMAHLGHVLYRLGKYGPAHRLLEGSLEIARRTGDLWQMARILNNLGILISSLDRHEEARSFCRESLELFRRLGNRRGAALALNNLGVEASALGDYPEAVRLYRESLAIFQELGDRRGCAFALANLGEVHREMGEYAEAERLNLEGLAVFQEIGDRWGVANVLCNLGAIAQALGKRPASRRYFSQALEMAVELQAVPLILEALVGLSQLLFEEGKPVEALEMVAFVLHHPALDWQDRERAGRLLEALRREVPPEAFAAALERGARRTIEDVLGRLRP